VQKQKISFQQFLEKFPEIELPVTITNDSQVEFSRHNEPLSAIMIEHFIKNIDGMEEDEYTEFVPCLKLPQTIEFHAIVVWKASLMNYQYVLLTFNKKGQLLDKAVIAGTYSDGDMLVQSVAQIEEDWIINIVSGKSSSTTSQNNYDASTSQTFNLELLANGQIITSN